MGEEFTYVLQRKYFISPEWVTVVISQLPFITGLDEGGKATAEVVSLDTFTEQINETYELPNAHVELRRENDSTVIMDDLITLIEPVGDWVFMTEIYNITNDPQLTLIESSTIWGMVGVFNFGFAGSVFTYTQELQYDKTNGTLEFLRIRYSAGGNDYVDIVVAHWYPGMPTIFVPGVDPMTAILVIALGVSVVLIVAVIVYMRVKRRKPLMQQLGE